MRVFSRHFPVERVGRPDPGLLHASHEVFLDSVEIAEFAIEMAGEQQNGVLKLALAVQQGALPEADNGEGGADRNGRDQQDPAEDQEV